MTIEQVKEIQEIINRRDFIDEKLRQMKLVKNVSFYIGRTNPILFYDFYNDDFCQNLCQDILNHSKATIISTLKGYRAELTEQLKKLGVED